MFPNHRLLPVCTGRLCAAVVSLWACAARATAQLMFDPPVVFPVAVDAAPTSIAIGDLNGDSLEDLVVTGRNLAGLVHVMIAAKGGGFAPPVPIAFEAFTDWAVLDHFDADVHLDLAVAVRSGVDKIALLRGNGDGTFGTRVDYDVGRGPSHFMARDLDGDNDVDLAVLDSGSDTVTILGNNGNAEFTKIQTIHIAQLNRGAGVTFYMTAADFNGDDKVDLAVAKTAGSIAILRNNGNGTFAVPVEQAIIPAKGNTGGGPTGVAAGDVDGDGDIDLVFAELINLFTPGNIGVLPNNGDGTFGAVLRFPSDGTTMWYADLADLNGDDLPEVILTDALGKRVELFENQTTAGVISFAASVGVSVNGFPRSTFALDIDEDCDLDVLVANIDTDQVQLLLNNTPQDPPCGTRQSSGTRRPISGLSIAPSRALLPGRHKVPVDTNHDGRIDSREVAEFLAQW